MSYFGSYPAGYFADYFGELGEGGAVDPIGPEGVALLGWDMESVRESYEWDTRIPKSFSGLERRIARLDKPRQSYSIPLVLGDPAARLLRSRLMVSPNGVYLMPRVSDSLTVFGVSGANVTVSATALAKVDWASPGRRVALLHGDTFEEFTLQSASGSTIELDSSPVATFPANIAAIAPLVHVNLEDGTGIGRHQVNVSRSDLQARALFTEDTFGTGAAAFTTLTVQSLARKIVTHQPIVQGLAQEQAAAGIEFLDYGGAREVLWGRTVSDHRRTYKFLIRNDDDRQWWKAFLYAIRGQQKAFLMPTWGQDLRVEGHPSGTTFTVYNTSGDPEQINYHALYAVSPAHRQLQITATDGTIYYRVVTGASDLEDGTDILTIASLTATIESICFLELVRLATDRVEIQWDGTMGFIELPMVTVQR